MITVFQRFRHLLQISTLSFLVALFTIEGHTQTDVEEVRIDTSLMRELNWRSHWRLLLTTVPTNPVIPDTIIITITNLWHDTLRGYGPFLSLYGLDAYSTGDSMSNRMKFVLPPGDSIEFRHCFRALKITWYGNVRQDTIKLVNDMKTKPWSMRAGFADIDSPKPMIESNPIVYSNMVTCNTEAAK